MPHSFKTNKYNNCIPSIERNAHSHSPSPFHCASFLRCKRIRNDTKKYETMQTNAILHSKHPLHLPIINTNKSFALQNVIHSFPFATMRRNHPPSLHPINTKESFAPIHPFHFSPIASHLFVPIPIP